MNKKWNNRETILFLERIEIYLLSGLSINNALRVTLQDANKNQKKGIVTMIENIEKGLNISTAIFEEMKIPATCKNLILHGESAGHLEKALGSARSLLERSESIKKKFVSAMVYPIVIASFASLLTFGLVRGVMPQIIPMLKSLHVELPLLTKIVITISEFVIDYGLYLLVVSIFSLSVFIFLYKKFKKIKYYFQLSTSSIPIIGSLDRKYQFSIFLISFGELIKSGIPIVIAYEETVKTLPSIPLRVKFQSKIGDLKSGVSFGKIISDLKIKIPPYVSPLLLAGESSGLLGDSALRASNILDNEIEQSLKKLTILIEPLMMVIMGVVVGSIALSIMMPIYNISKVLQH